MTMDSILQIMLLAASCGLGMFCILLARRLHRLNNLESGIGGAIAVMSAEVDRLDRAIRKARAEASVASEALAEEIAQARGEREMWDLRQKMDAGFAIGSQSRSPASRRLRKRLPEDVNA